MDDDAVLKMYKSLTEAQTIILEKQKETERSNREKEELEEKMRRLYLDRECEYCC